MHGDHTVTMDQFKEMFITFPEQLLLCDIQLSYNNIK